MRILITGAARAIGAATAAALAARGHEVIATARDRVALDNVDAARKLPMDVCDPDSIAAALAQAGEIDAVVNNAAVATAGPLEDYPMARLQELFDTNCFGPLRLVQAMAPVVQEIAQHSLAPGELILKRLVGDHRREEIFVSKAALDQKLAPLSEGLKSRFFALGLSPSLSRQPPPPPESRARSIRPVQEPTVVVSEVEDVDEDQTAAFLLAGRSS